MAVEAVEAAARRYGLASRRESSTSHAVWIVSEQRRSVVQIVLRTLPQVVTWRLHQQGRHLTIQAEFSVFRWYATLLIGLFFVIAATFAAMIALTHVTSSFEYSWLELHLLGLFPPVALLALAEVWLLGPLGGGSRVTALWQSVLAPLEEDGTPFQPRGLGQTRSYLRWAAAYFCFALLLISSAFLLDSGTVRLHISRGGFVSLSFVLSGCLFLFALYLNPYRRSFQLRSDPMLPGVLTMLAVAALLHVPLPLQLIPVLDSSEPEQKLVAAGLYDRLNGRFNIGAVSLLAIIAAILGASAIRTALYVQPSLQRLQNGRRVALYHQAVGNFPSYRRFRAVFVAFWGLSSSLILIQMGYVLLCALQALTPVFSQPSLRLSETTARLLAAAADVPLDTRWTRWAARGSWVFLGAIVLALPLISIGQLVLARRAERRFLSTAPLPLGARVETSREQVARLSRRVGLPPAQLVILPDPRPYVATQCFGFWGRVRFIVASEGALEDFDAEELEAMFAHELIHLRQGHCRMVVFLRWLGRLTFVGDGFALALQNSFGYELEADELLLGESLASREALERCFIKLEHASPGWNGLHRLTQHANSTSDGQQISPTQPHYGPTLGQQWSVAWSVFCQQYFAAMRLHYWHPSFHERRAAIRATSDGSAG